MIKTFLRKWQQYRYRFVPWIALNLTNRSSRSVEEGLDKVIEDSHVIQVLEKLFTELHCNQYGSSEHGYDNADNVSAWYNSPGSHLSSRVVYEQGLSILYQEQSFVIERRPSMLPSGGTGVFVTKGTVRKGVVVALYPGSIYQPYEPLFWQSLGNSFIFRCIDGILIDGNDRNISKLLYKSCCHRDRVGPYLTADLSWVTEYPINPLAVGQYVNNQSKKYPANVAYQECDIPADFPLHLCQYLPNVHYSSSIHFEHSRLIRVVALVSLRDIDHGEELFSSYYTIVH